MNRVGRYISIKNKKITISSVEKIHYYNMEAATGFEPVIKVLQTSALPLGYAAKK